MKTKSIMLLGVFVLAVVTLAITSLPKQKANADDGFGTECVLGPGNCGCYWGYGSCVKWFRVLSEDDYCAEEVGPDTVYWELRQTHAYVYENGKRVSGYSGWTALQGDCYHYSYTPTGNTCDTCGW